MAVAGPEPVWWVTAAEVRRHEAGTAVPLPDHQP
jgi:hypothetical protein